MDEYELHGHLSEQLFRAIGIISRISLVQLAGSVRKFNLNRPFICPILMIDSAHLIVSSEFSQLRTTAHIMVTKSKPHGLQGRWRSGAGMYQASGESDCFRRVLRV